MADIELRDPPAIVRHRGFPRTTLASLLQGATIDAHRILNPRSSSLVLPHAVVAALVRRADRRRAAGGAAGSSLPPMARLAGQIIILQGAPRYFKDVALDALLVGPGGPTHAALLHLPGVGAPRRVFWKGAVSKEHLGHLQELGRVLASRYPAAAVSMGLFQRPLTDAFELVDLPDSHLPYMFLITMPTGSPTGHV
jgi:hypothetical protein